MSSLLKLQFGDTNIRARRGISPETPIIDPRRTICPTCKVAKRRKKAIADCTQRGFTWDNVKTVFQCACGQQFYVEYKVWHDETVKDSVQS